MSKLTELFPTDESHTTRLKAPDGIAIDITVRTDDRRLADKWIAAIREAHSFGERVPAPPSRLERDLAKTVDLLLAFFLCAWVTFGAACGALHLGVGDPSQMVEVIKGLGIASVCSLIVAVPIALVNSAIREHRERAWRPALGGAA